MNVDNNNNVRNFVNFLKNHEVGRGVEPSHTTLGYTFGLPWSRYFISDKDNDTFLNLYKRVLMDYLKNESTIKESPLHIVERPKRVGPILVDLDFRQKSKDRCYTDDTIKHIIDVYNDLIKKYVDVDDEKINAFVFEKAKPSYDEGKDNYKDGFHIIYPEIVIDASLRYKILEEVQQIVTDEKVLDDIECLNTMDEIFDKSIVMSNGWMMYRSRKYKCQEYKLTNIYDCNLEKKSIQLYSPDELVVLLSLRVHGQDTALRLSSEYDNDEFKKVLESTYEKYHRNKKKENALARECEKKSVTERVDKMIDNKNTHDNVSKNGPEIEMASKLSAILSKERASKYQSWLHVGWALYDVDESLLDCFISFSKKCPEKYEPGCCEKVWSVARKGGFTMSSLHWWAKQDNPLEYTKLITDNVKKIMYEAESGSHDDIAKVVYELYKYSYRCVSIEKNKWYEFQGHRWVYIDSGYTLANKISDEVTKEFANLTSQYYAESAQKTASERDDKLAKAQRVSKIILLLKNESFKASLLKSCARRFYDAKFEEKLDDNPYLMGFENGIYDFKNRCFRNGVPDDYVSLSTEYDYEEFEENDDIIQEIEAYFRQVQREPEMKLYILKLIASHLVGINKSQQCILWTGKGGNGKSTTIDMIHYAFGKYFDLLPITVLTRKRQGADNATPSLADKRGKRFLALQEPEDDDVIHVGLMKELVTDWITARALYGAMFKYKPQFKMVLPCNKLPTIPSTDGGTWRRLRVSPWESKFVDVPDPDKPNEFPRDPDLEEKVKTWKQPFMWLLINVYYPKYCEEGLREPKKVLQYTDKFKKGTDVYLEFLSGNVLITKNDKDSESLKTLYSSFKAWHVEQYPNTRSCPAYKDFVNYFEDNGYKIENGGKVLGMKFNALEV
jgi:P4 family phage/plasmid primase-like protien